MEYLGASMADIFRGPPVAGGAPLPSAAWFGVASTVVPDRSWLRQLLFVRWCSVVMLAACLLN